MCVCVCVDETIATTNTILEKETDESIIDYIERIVATLNALPVTISQIIVTYLIH